MATVNDVTNVVYSGDARVDALLFDGPDWNYLLPTRTTLFYTFDLGVIATQGAPVQAFNAAQQAAATQIISYVSSVTGITFSLTASGSLADFHFANKDVAGATTAGIMESTEGWSSNPVAGTLLSYAAEAFIFLDNIEFLGINSAPTGGSDGYEVLLHEVGHALGLKHPFEDPFKLPAAQDNTNNTVMSYTHAGGNKSVFQSYDLLTLRWIYGADGLLGSFGINSTNGPSLNTGGTATYALAAVASSVNEGSSASFTLTTTNVANGTVLNYTVGGGVDATDITGGALAGTVTINNNTASVVVPLVADVKTEGAETLTVAITGTTATASVTVNDTSTAAPVQTVSYTVPGTLGADAFVLSGGNSHLGGAGNDTYIISPSTLAAGVTASISDTEGSDLVQLVDGAVVASSSFFANAVQLKLSNGATIQILGASRLSFQVGGNLVAGDAATNQSYSAFAATLGGGLPSGSAPVSGLAGFTVPTAFVAAGAPVAGVAGSTATVPGTLSNDVMVAMGGNSFRGGAGNDTYLIGKNTLAGAVTATITDTEGSNIIQLVDGTVITSSSFFSNAVQLTLSTGASVQILGTSNFSYQLGANVTAGDTSASLSYAQFGAVLGVTVPGVGGAAVSGTPNFAVPTGAGAVLAALVGVADPAATGLGADLQF